jgi:hypothetical protein
MRDYRVTSEKQKLTAARKDGFAEALRAVRVAFLQSGDTGFDGFSAAEMVGRLSLD